MGKFSDLPVEIKVQDTKTGTGKIITFFGIKRDDLVNVETKLKASNSDQNIKSFFKKGPALIVVVDNDKIDAFIDSGLKTIQFVIVNSGNYDGNGIAVLTDEVAFKCNKISDEEKKQLFADAEASEIEQWQNYLNSVNDPKTQEMLKLYSQIYGNTIYGHALSLKNAMTIRRIDPNATFVLGESSWVKYGRGVKRGAKKYPLFAMKEMKPDNADLLQAQRILGHENSNYNDLSVTVKDAIYKKAGQIALEKNGGKFQFFKYIGYDISDTYRHSTNVDDPLYSKPGIISNVSYKLNQLAQDIESQKNNNLHNDIEGHDKMLEKTEKAVSIVEDLCNKSGIKINTNSSNPSVKLTDLLYDYYKPTIVSKGNILKDGNVSQFAEDAVQLTLLMNNIALDQLNRFKHSYIYTQKEAAALGPIIRRMVDAIGKGTANLSENVFNNNKEDFLIKYKQALKDLGIKVVKDKNENLSQETNTVNAEEEINNNDIETIKENFYKVFNKINSDIF